jgi:hypothetical protein
MDITYVDLIEPLKEGGKGEQTNNCSHITCLACFSNSKAKLIIRPIIIIITIIFLHLLLLLPNHYFRSMFYKC